LQFDVVMDQRSSPRRSSRTPSPHGGARLGAGRPASDDMEEETPEASSPSRLSSLHAARDAAKAEKASLAESHALLKGRQGRSLSAEEGAMALALIFGLRLYYDKNETDAIDTAAMLLGKCGKTLRALLHHWQQANEILVESSANRGGGSPYHRYHDVQLESEHIATIHRTIVDANEDGSGCTTLLLLDALNRAHGLSIGDRTLRRILNRIGYCYGRSKNIGNMNREDRRKRTIVFMKQYAKAIAEETAGSAIIVYQDESYVNQFHSTNYTWYAPASPSSNEVARSPSKGKRLIIVHAITRWGLLTAWEGDSPAIATHDVQQQALNAELVFEGHYADGDYHKNMDGDVFNNWLRNRFIPTFKRLFPNKKCYLILDNAKYHHARGADFIDPNTMNKSELVTALLSFDIEEIEVSRGGQRVRMKKAAFYQRGGRSAPKNDELKAALQEYLDAHPQHQRSRAQKAFDAEGWQLIFTPPYNSECQPIEKIWANVKGHVARAYEVGRSLEMLRQQTLDGFYGTADGSHAGISPELCCKYIDHCQRYCDLFIKANVPDAECLYDLAAGDVVAARPQAIDQDVADEEDERDDSDDDGAN
jgi:hypothetical protein